MRQIRARPVLRQDIHGAYDRVRASDHGWVVFSVQGIAPGQGILTGIQQGDPWGPNFPSMEEIRMALIELENRNQNNDNQLDEKQEDAEEAGAQPAGSEEE